MTGDLGQNGSVGLAVAIERLSFLEGKAVDYGRIVSRPFGPPVAWGRRVP